MEMLPDDEGEVRQFLLRHLGDSIQSVDLLGQGEWSRAYSFKHLDEDLVVRFSRWEDDFLKDRRSRRYVSPRLHIPRVARIGVTPGGFYAISERVFGSSFDDVGPAQMPGLF